MSKITYLAIIVLSTLECMINGEKVTFLPSPEPQKVPKPDAEEAVKRSLAKKVAKAPAKKKEPDKPNGGSSTSSDDGGGDDSGSGDPAPEDKDKVNV